MGLAVVFWMVIVGAQSFEIGMTVPIEYQAIAPTIQLRGEVPRELSIRLRGSRFALEFLRAQPLRARISLAHVQAGINYIPLTKGQIDLPPGIEVTEIRPALYAVVLNLEYMSVETAADIVVYVAQRPEYQPTPASEQRLADLGLSARVQAWLAVRGIEMAVRAENGIVWLAGFADSPERIYETIQAVQALPGVKEVVADLTIRPTSAAGQV